MKRLFFLGLLAACSHLGPTTPLPEKPAAPEAALLGNEDPWLLRAEALHDFMLDYYKKGRSFRGRNILGLAELQRLILKNRSEAWQPYLPNHELRIAWSLDFDEERGDENSIRWVHPYTWTFFPGWQDYFQQRFQGYKRSMPISEGITLWILPSEDFATKLDPSAHAWLLSMGVVVTTPKREFFLEDGVKKKQVSVDETGVYLESSLEDNLRVKNHVTLVINDVQPFDVDSSHRCLTRERVSRAATALLAELKTAPEKNKDRIRILEKQLAGEREGRPESIEFLERDLVGDHHLTDPESKRGFEGLWEAYLRNQVAVSRIPGLEYQADPEFLVHLDELVRIYRGEQVAMAAPSREPSSTPPSSPSSTRHQVGLEFDDYGTVLGLIKP